MRVLNVFSKTGLFALSLSAQFVRGTELDLKGVEALVGRRLPSHAKQFTFQSLDAEGDTFVLKKTRGHGGGITVSCTTVSACARGVYEYLTEYGGVDIWWTGSRLDQLPARLPQLRATVRGSSIVPLRYHFNTVTFGYTTAFWKFDKWSLLLDWLALRGVNLPLAWVGYESILIDVFRDAGLPDAEILDFLSGPAFWPWNRFGNIQGSWGGELPMQWVSDQFALGKQIIQRMVELGMRPVLPAFTGFVPRALARHYPNAAIVNGSQWEGFPSSLTNVSFLEPFDPLFTTLQTSFMSKQQAAYGNVSHIYTLDQYNENDPFSGDLDYLRNVTRNTFASLRSADPDAVWLMQGWLFFSSETFWTNERIEAYLGGVEGNDSMIILDLYSEAQPQWNRTNNYFGKQWVWCELHDYGGNMGFEGNLGELTSGPIAALKSPGSSMKGMGLTMEGQEGNEIVYDILLDQAWSPTPLKVQDYVKKWVARRYPVKSLPEEANRAWSILSKTVYNNKDPNSKATIKSILELAPSLTGLVNRTGHHPTLVPYNTNTTILPALKLLLQASQSHPALKNIPEFRYDIVDLGRQLLANRFILYYQTLLRTYNTSSSPESVAASGQPLLGILRDLDTLLCTDANFLLSGWIADARSWASGSSSNPPFNSTSTSNPTTSNSNAAIQTKTTNTTYANYLEYNARNQITLWGPDGEINDYASKQWAGLVGGYYLPRWEAFVDYLVKTKKSGEAYNTTLISVTLLEIGRNWTMKIWGESGGEGWGTRGDTLVVAKDVLERWG